MTKRKSFLVYFDCKEHLELLTKEECGELFLALIEYADTGTIPNFDGMAKMAFSFIRAQMDRDTAKYLAICQRNKTNGSKGGRPPNEDNSQE